MKINMTRRIDKIEQILGSIESVMHGHRLSLHSDTTLSLDFQLIEELIRRVFRYSIGDFQESIGESGLAMVDVSYDTEISDSLRRKVFSFV
jgi:hypothetical protein